MKRNHHWVFYPLVVEFEEDLLVLGECWIFIYFLICLNFSRYNILFSVRKPNDTKYKDILPVTMTHSYHFEDSTVF